MQGRVLEIAGLRKTKARSAVFDILEKKRTPVDVNEIFNLLKVNSLRVDQATVYRIVDAFLKAGLIRKLELQEGKYRYEIAKDDHHHLICQVCGTIEDISDCNIQSLEKDINRKKKFLVKTHSLEFFGICNQCQQ